MTKIRPYITDLNKPSLFLMFLPYLSYNTPDMLDSGLFDGIMYAGYIFLIVLADLALKRIAQIDKLYIWLFVIGLVAFWTTFWYEAFLSKPIFEYIKLNYYGHLQWLRYRHFLILLFLLCFGFLSINKRGVYLLINRTCLISFFIISFAILSATKKDSIHKKKSAIFLSSDIKENKPILFLICDEYHSPKMLYALNKEKSIYHFDNYLKKNQWVTRSVLKSKFPSTIHSIASLFNFNSSPIYQDKTLWSVSRVNDSLMKNELMDSLISKNVRVSNMSIFKLSDYNALKRLYVYPVNFFELFF